MAIHPGHPLSPYTSVSLDLPGTVPGWPYPGHPLVRVSPYTTVTVDLPRTVPGWPYTPCQSIPVHHSNCGPSRVCTRMAVPRSFLCQSISVHHSNCGPSWDCPGMAVPRSSLCQSIPIHHSNFGSPGTVPVWLYPFQYTTVTAKLPVMAVPWSAYVRVHMKHVAIACDCYVDRRCTAERIGNVLCSCVL